MIVPLADQIPTARPSTATRSRPSRPVDPSPFVPSTAAQEKRKEINTSAENLEPVHKAWRLPDHEEAEVPQQVVPHTEDDLARDLSQVIDDDDLSRELSRIIGDGQQENPLTEEQVSGQLVPQGNQQEESPTENQLVPTESTVSGEYEGRSQTVIGEGDGRSQTVTGVLTDNVAGVLTDNTADVSTDNVSLENLYTHFLLQKATSYKFRPTGEVQQLFRDTNHMTDDFPTKRSFPRSILYNTDGCGNEFPWSRAESMYIAECPGPS